MDNELLFTPASVLSLLTGIEELKDKEIQFEENEDSVVIHIGDSQYTVDTSNAQEVEVDEETVETVGDINEEGYQEVVDENEDADFDLADEEELEEESEEAVEGGIIKEIAKTLLVGGLVRLTTGMLKQ